MTIAERALEDTFTVVPHKRKTGIKFRSHPGLLHVRRVLEADTEWHDFGELKHHSHSLSHPLHPLIHMCWAAGGADGRPRLIIEARIKPGTNLNTYWPEVQYRRVHARPKLTLVHGGVS